MPLGLNVFRTGFSEGHHYTTVLAYCINGGTATVQFGSNTAGERATLQVFAKRCRRNVLSRQDVPLVVTLFNQRGVTYLGVMAAIVLMGISMTVVGKQWTVVMKRDKEAELLFRGNRIKAAIEWYAADYQVRKGTRPNQYPLRLEQLVEGPKRYLPVVYQDPVTGQDFDLIKVGPEIQGVKSRSHEVPLDQVRFKPASQYREMLFVAEKPGVKNGCVPILNVINPLLSTTCRQGGGQSGGTPAAQSGSPDSTPKIP